LRKIFLGTLNICWTLLCSAIKISTFLARLFTSAGHVVLCDAKQLFLCGNFLLCGKALRREAPPEF
jgi:hypothetical protein